MRHDARIPTFALALALAAPAFAAPPAPAPPPPPNQDAPKREKAPSERPRSLDDLLGLPERSDKADAPPPPDTAPEQAQRELERALRGESVGEMFEEAVLLMRDAAQRVDQRRDVGATTQRMQEEIIARLDAVIAKARQQQQQQQSSSSSSSSSQSEQQQQPGQRGRQQQQPQQSRGEPNDSTGQSGAQDSAETRGWLDSAAPTWGKLPDRLRDALLQGAGDSFSSLYERMTEEYYRRLAEERPNP